MLPARASPRRLRGDSRNDQICWDIAYDDTSAADDRTFSDRGAGKHRRTDAEVRTGVNPAISSHRCVWRNMRVGTNDTVVFDDRRAVHDRAVLDLCVHVHDREWSDND